MGWLKTIPAFLMGLRISLRPFYAVTSDPAFRSAFHSAFDFAFDFAIVAIFKMTKQSGIVLP